MIRPGQIVLFRFPQTDAVSGKLRPALILRRVPGRHDDWLVCMVSSQVEQEVAGFDEIIRDTDSDFTQTGLKQTSLVRVGRLAVVTGSILLGAIGYVQGERVDRICSRLAQWISGQMRV